MPYLVKGNAEQLFSAFGCSQLIREHDQRTDVVSCDLIRTHFLGNEAQANQHVNIWGQEAVARYYNQGNQSAEVLKFVLGGCPLKKEQEDEEEYKRQFVCQSFAYIDDKQENCALMVMYRRDEPGQWVMGFTRKAHINPKNRPVTLLSGFDLTTYIENTEFEVTSTEEPWAGNQLVTQLNAAIPGELLHLAFCAERGEINPRFERIRLLLRQIQLTAKGAVIVDPVDLSDINLAQLFADNPALDLIMKYNVPFSSGMLQDCLAEDKPKNGRLRYELENVTLHDEDRCISRNILYWLTIFYEEQVIYKKEDALETNRHLLQNYELIDKFNGYMWDREQVILLPILYREQYSLELMQLILSEEPYFRAVNRLAQLQIGFIQNVPRFFKEPLKLAHLKYIDGIVDENCKNLCLILWATCSSKLAVNDYEKIVAAANEYPFMASTLVTMARNGTVLGGIEAGLMELALNPKQHLKESIINHFFSDPVDRVINKSLKKMKLDALKAISTSLYTLLSSQGNSIEYRWVLDPEDKGKALRLFLPQIATIRDTTQRQILIGILFAGIKYGISIQGDEVSKIKNREQQAVAKKFYERFICVRQLQKLQELEASNISDEMIAFAAQTHDEKAERFRKIILQVEKQCGVIHTRLHSSVAYRDMLSTWGRNEANYKNELYRIVSGVLMRSEGEGNNVQDALLAVKEVEKNMLGVVDPDKTSNLSNFLIILSNVVIGLLTMGVLHYTTWWTTGNYCFFNQSRSGEDVRALSKELISSLESDVKIFSNSVIA